MQQADDFFAECAVLHDLLKDNVADVFDMKTQFKDWSIADVIGHLHMFNVAARLTLEDGAKFHSFFAPVAKTLAKGGAMMDAQKVWLGDLGGQKLFDTWWEECERTTGLYRKADPKHRVKWAGPDMSTRSSITARQMETWAHGQEIFDRLGEDRTESDRIKNIAHLGVNTFGWTFINRKETVPDPVPHVALTAPSGHQWQWHEEQADNRVSGSAVEFCQVVAQTRNIADTNLKTIGPIAERWMAVAQCFAGEAVDPPAAGLRHKV